MLKKTFVAALALAVVGVASPAQAHETWAKFSVTKKTWCYDTTVDVKWDGLPPWKRQSKNGARYAVWAQDQKVGRDRIHVVRCG